MKKIYAMLLLSAASSVTFSDSQTQLYWGDTHLHTKYSGDAFLYGNHSVGPDEAYRFAKGEPVVHPYHRARVQLDRPLDFLVVSDHAEMLGVMNGIYHEQDYGEIGLRNKILRWFANWQLRRVLDKGEGAGAFNELLPPAVLLDGEDPITHPAHEPLRNQLGDVSDINKNVWAQIVGIADAHNNPGVFTTFIGWEWSSVPLGANLHRVVFTSSGAAAAKQYLPFSSMDSEYPTDLWNWLDKTASNTGSEFIAIPHNSNISRGYMFAETTLEGDKITPDYAQLRARYEPVVEITQIKGDSETWPSFSPQDPFANFESYEHYLMRSGGAEEVRYTAKSADFVRQGLATGLKLDLEIGVNPFKFGFIGSTDAHTGLSSADSDNFHGKMAFDSIPQNKPSPDPLAVDGWNMSASGLAAVWAEENTRESIFSAFKRREVYATTGPRISLRVFGGFDLDKNLASASDFVARAYKVGVPMGGDLLRPGEGQRLSLAIKAAKDPQGANLDQLHVVKGWLDQGKRSTNPALALSRFLISRR